METQEVPTALELAKKQGKATGLVSTSQINHATPASFGAHDESRHDYDQLPVIIMTNSLMENTKLMSCLVAVPITCSR